MIERFIAPALTFTVLIGGHVAIAMAMFSSPAAQDAVQAKTAPVVVMEAVIVTGKRTS
jgi:hypothetical protein